MRAQSINFERGLDPKKSMSIGRHWSKTKREIANEIIRRCESELEDVINNVHAKAKMKGYKNSFDYIEQAYGIENSNINKDPVIENAIEDVTIGINKILEEYPIFEPDKNDSLMNDITNFFTAGEPPFGTLMTIIEAALDPRLKESVNFERGIEPKTAMRVGMSKAIPSIVEALLRYDQDGEKNIIQEVRFYKESVEFSCAAYDDLTDKERADYCRKLILKFHLDPFVILKPIKLYRIMGSANFFFDLTEIGQKVNPKKRYYLHRDGNVFTTEDNKVSSFVQDYLNAKTLKEAYDFERGLAPLKSLGIGQKEIKKKLIKILPDLSKNILWDEMYKQIIDGIKREDTIISMNDEYIIVKSPVLTWRFADNLRLILNMSDVKVSLEKKPSREHIYLRGPEWMVFNYKTPRVYKYRIL